MPESDRQCLLQSPSGVNFLQSTGEHIPISMSTQLLVMLMRAGCLCQKGNCYLCARAASQITERWNCIVSLLLCYGSCLSAASLFFSSALAILSHVFLRKPWNNLVSVLSVCHIKCCISGDFWENSRGEIWQVTQVLLDLLKKMVNLFHVDSCLLESFL